MVLTALKKEFQMKNFFLDHHFPELFVKSQWQWPSWIYLAYKVLVVVYLMIWLILSGTSHGVWYTDEGQRVKWFIYLTNWTYFMLTLSGQVQLAIVCFATWRMGLRDREIPIYDYMPTHLKAAWVIHNIATNISPLVTISYWTLVYNGQAVDHVDLSTHGLNSAVVLIDVCVSATPLRLFHAVHGMTFVTCYVIFNAIYVSAGGTNALHQPYIYSILGRDNPGLTVGLSVLLVLAAGVVWCVVFALYMMKLAVYRKVNRSELPSREREDLLLAESENE